MPQNYRQPPGAWRSDQAAGYAREGRYPSSSERERERDRYRSGEEQRYRPESRWQPGQAGASAWRDDEVRSRSDREYWERQANRNQADRDDLSRDPYRDSYHEAEDTFHGRPLYEEDIDDRRSFFGTGGGNYAGVEDYAPLSRMRGGGFYAEDDHRHEHAHRSPRTPVGGYDPHRPVGNQSYASSYGYGGNDYQNSHRGRGPKGYERSDERLREIICERLTDDPWIDASEVSIEVNNKTVRLTGTVDNRQTKYEIEELIERSTNVREIDNQLRVQSPQYQGRSDTGFGTSTQSSSSTRGSSTSQSTSQASGLSSAGITSGGSSATSPGGSTRKN
jgi:hypothetical protein